MSEENLQNRVLKMLRGIGHVQKHNDITPGIPDLSVCVDGFNAWIELKYAVRPVRDKSIVRVDFKPAQKLWLRKRGEAGGACFVLLECDDTVMLFGWMKAVEYVGSSGYNILLNQCDSAWHKKVIHGESLVHEMKKISKKWSD